MRKQVGVTLTGFIMVAVVVVLMLLFAFKDDAGAANDPRLRTGERGIVMLTAEWCGYCRKQEALLAAAGVSYEALDVDTDKGALALEALDGSGVPLTVIGQDVIHGFDPDALRAALAPLGYRIR